MSLPARCRSCNHQVGMRSTNNTGKEGISKKSPCGCACHTQASLESRRATHQAQTLANAEKKASEKALAK